MPEYERLKAEDLNDEGCLRLIEAIVGSAADEWRNCRLALALEPNDRRNREHMDYLEKFFRSEYFHDLTNLDGESVLKKLESDWVANRKMKVSAILRGGGCR